MPLAAGLVSIIVALEKLIEPSEGGPLHLRWLDLSIWALGLSCSGTFLAMLLRWHILKQDNMPFPSATASATMIKVLHSEESGTIDTEATGAEPLLRARELDIAVGEDAEETPHYSSCADSIYGIWRDCEQYLQ